MAALDPVPRGVDHPRPVRRRHGAARHRGGGAGPGRPARRQGRRCHRPGRGRLPGGRDPGVRRRQRGRARHAAGRHRPRQGLARHQGLADRPGRPALQRRQGPVRRGRAQSAGQLALRAPLVRQRAGRPERVRGAAAADPPGVGCVVPVHEDRAGVGRGRRPVQHARGRGGPRAVRPSRRQVPALLLLPVHSRGEDPRPGARHARDRGRLPGAAARRDRRAGHPAGGDTGADGRADRRAAGRGASGGAHAPQRRGRSRAAGLVVQQDGLEPPEQDPPA